MSDENPPPGNENQESGLPSDTDEENESGSSLSLKKIILFAVLPIILLFGGVGGLWIGGVFGGGERAIAEENTNGNEEGGEEGDELAQANEEEYDEEYSDEDGEGRPKTGGVFYELPEMLVNLTASSRRASFLKIKLSLELDAAEDVALIEKSLPRITDNFQVYLRELRSEDLKGSAGIHRLREELLTRLEVSARPAKVRDILFKEVLVQ